MTVAFRKLLCFHLLLCALLIAGCVTPAKDGATATPQATPQALRDGFTATPAAQPLLQRGLTLSYAFNHGLSEKKFREAAAADPDCAMAWWGVALVNGPHINFPMVPPANAQTAWDALAKAQALAPKASGKEQALIAALSQRYANPQPDDRHPLDQAYAAAMRTVAQQYPEDADIATLFAESMMDLRPWDLWQKDGSPQPGTKDILAALERAMQLDPKHPGATHLYIHAAEASRKPERAEPAADALRAVAPSLGLGVGHLIHMPSHIYARVGRWDDAAQANQDAKASDTKYRAENPNPGFFALYMIHNRHFYAWSACMQGRSGEAVTAAREMVESIPEEFITNFGPVVDGFLVFPSETLMRFGRWEELLAEPAPRAGLPYSTAMWHFTRAVALTALNQMDAAVKEQEAFRAAAAKVPAESTFGNNKSYELLTIAGAQLEGEMAAQRQDYAAAVQRLEEAVRMEDTLRYDEPPDWIQPVRHTLGAVLLRAARPAEAEQVYREDLRRMPENPWSLYGLGRSLRLQGKDLDAAMIEQRFEQAWKQADVKMQASCFCQPAV